MALKYPLMLEIGLPLAIILLVLFHIVKRKHEYKGGVRVANASYARKLPGYRKKRIFNLVVTIVLEAALVLSLISSFLLAARPYEIETVNKGEKKRDIFLCMDVSYSLCDLNSELVQSLKDVVSNLDGDRFGITIYNTSFVLYVPMTDDYEFVLDRLDKLKEYFDVQKEYMDEFGDKYYLEPEDMDRYNELEEELEEFDAGTLVNNTRLGSSLVGVGLASCLYNFPKLDDEARTRLILMPTDNCQEALEKPIVQLDEASDLCKKYEVKIFGIFPNTDSYSWMNTKNYDSVYSDFKDAVEKTGGKIYKQSENLSVEDIVQKIENEEAKEVAALVVKQEVDQPEVWTIILLISISLFFVMGVIRR